MFFRSLIPLSALAFAILSKPKLLQRAQTIATIGAKMRAIEALSRLDFIKSTWFFEKHQNLLGFRKPNRFSIEKSSRYIFSQLHFEKALELTAF